MIDTTKALIVLALGMLIVSLLGGISWAWNSHNQAQQQIGVDRAERQCRLDKDKDAAQQRLREQANFKRQEIAANERAKIEGERDAARAAARAVDLRLRDARHRFDRALDAATAETAISAARTLGTVFDACVAEYRSVADAADGHLTDAQVCAAGWPQ